MTFLFYLGTWSSTTATRRALLRPAAAAAAAATGGAVTPRRQSSQLRPAFLLGRGCVASTTVRCLEGRSTAILQQQQQQQQQQQPHHPLHLSAPLKSRLFSTIKTTTTTEDSEAAATTRAHEHHAGSSYDVLNRQGGLDSYDPASFEADIYKWWETSGCFLPDAKQHSHHDKSHDKIVSNENKENKQRESYVLPMPPPNVTGRLHMGHAIFVALQDVLARFHRMRGKAVLWLPGTDHAGIATQLQVEKQLLAQDPPMTRQDVGRAAFLQRVWDYQAEQGGHITRQLRSLGASADWSRERFTMDLDLSRAVVEAFVRLHDKGLVYRGEYIVNWAPRLQTAVSDLEVEYFDEMGKLFYFKYLVQGSEGKVQTQSVCAD
jgi:valyl-tRNA synthetase